MRSLLGLVVLAVALSVSGCIGALSVAHTAFSALYVAHSIEGIRMMISARESVNADGTVEKPLFGTKEAGRVRVEQAIARSSYVASTQTSVKGYRCDYLIDKKTNEIRVVKVSLRAECLMYFEINSNNEIVSVLWRSAALSSSKAGEVKDGLESRLGKK